MKNKPDTIIVYSDDIRDVVARPPSWLLRWGIAWILVILCTILTMASIIKYPDTVSAKIKINGINAPKALIPKISGTLIKLIAKDGQKVKNTENIAWLESSANHQQILDLLAMCKSIRDNSNFKSFKFKPPACLSLGELQESYHQFYLVYLNYLLTINEDMLLKHKHAINRAIALEKAQKQHLLRQRDLFKNGYLIFNGKYQNNDTLKSSLIAQQLSVDQIGSNLVANDERLLNRHKELKQLNHQIFNDKKDFIQALGILISTLEEWKEKYIISANQDGKLVFFGMIKEGQYIDTSIPLFYIDKGSTDYYCEMYITQANLWKVNKGQIVQIKLNSLPYQQCGMLNGKVLHINDIPFQDSIYLSRVKLLKGQQLLTRLRVGMTGKADVITANVSLLRRMTQGIFKANIK